MVKGVEFQLSLRAWGMTPAQIQTALDSDPSDPLVVDDYLGPLIAWARKAWGKSVVVDASLEMSPLESLEDQVEVELQKSSTLFEAQGQRMRENRVLVGVKSEDQGEPGLPKSSTLFDALT